MENYLTYLRWCCNYNEKNLIDPTSDEMQWNHTLPQCLFKGHGPGQWLTLRQHAIASALQTLVFNKNCLCGWHKNHTPLFLWNLCFPLYSKAAAKVRRNSNHRRYEEGTHPMQQENNRESQSIRMTETNLRMVQQGIHPSQSESNKQKKREQQLEKVKNGTHHVLTKEFSELISKQRKGTKWWVSPEGVLKSAIEKPPGNWQNGRKWRNP